MSAPAMTTTTTSGQPTAAGAPADGRPAPGARRPRYLVPALWAVGIVLVLVGSVLLVGSRQEYTGSLDPANTGSDGAGALATALSQHGVHVSVVRTQRDYLAAPVGPGTTVLVTGTGELSGQTAATAIRHARTADRLVAVDAGITVLRGMGVPADLHGPPANDADAGCSSPDVHPGDRVSAADLGYTATGSRTARTGVVRCFDGSYLSLPAGATRPATVLLGSAQMLANGTILAQANAAVAVRTLGHSSRLVWYVPSTADIQPGDTTSFASQLPRWLDPALWLLLVGFAVLVLWRGRRLGRLAAEPLPVVVRALETTRSRGQMYRKARDVGRTAEVLRIGTRTRLARYLGLGAAVGGTELVRAVAVALDRPVADVEAILLGPAPPSEDALLDLSRDLITMEEEVRHR